MASFAGVCALVEERAAACVPVVRARKGAAHTLVKGADPGKLLSTATDHGAKGEGPSPAGNRRAGATKAGGASPGKQVTNNSAAPGGGATTLADVTHVITHATEMLKSTKPAWDAVTLARGNSGLPPPIAVTAEWVGESVLAGRLLPAERFPVALPGGRKARAHGHAACQSDSNSAPSSTFSSGAISAPDSAPNSAPMFASPLVLDGPLPQLASSQPLFPPASQGTSRPHSQPRSQALCQPGSQLLPRLPSSLDGVTPPAKRARSECFPPPTPPSGASPSTDNRTPAGGHSTGASVHSTAGGVPSTAMGVHSSALSTSTDTGPGTGTRTDGSSHTSCSPSQHARPGAPILSVCVAGSSRQVDRSLLTGASTEAARGVAADSSNRVDVEEMMARIFGCAVPGTSAGVAARDASSPRQLGSMAGGGASGVGPSRIVMAYDHHGSNHDGEGHCQLDGTRLLDKLGMAEGPKIYSAQTGRHGVHGDGRPLGKGPHGMEGSRAPACRAGLCADGQVGDRDMAGEKGGGNVGASLSSAPSILQPSPLGMAQHGSAAIGSVCQHAASQARAAPSPVEETGIRSPATVGHIDHGDGANRVDPGSAFGGMEKSSSQGDGMGGLSRGGRGDGASGGDGLGRHEGFDACCGGDRGGGSGFLNDHLIGPLKEMSVYYDTALKGRNPGNRFKQLVYGKAIDALKKLGQRVDRVEDLPAGTQFIGKELRRHIEELLTTGTFPQLEGARNDPEARIIKKFMDVPWFGPKKAEELYSKGCRTLEDVARDPSLNPNQRVCLEHAEDLSTPIPRAEVAEIAKWVALSAEKVAPREGLRVICGGSYRRGEPKCNDIDFVITHEDGASHRGLCERLVAQLEAEGLVTHRLGSGSHYWRGPKSKWELEDPTQTFMGLCRLPEGHVWSTGAHQGAQPDERYRYRRIDIKVYPRAAFAFASIYFTGGLLLNRSLRGHARTGMHPPHKLTDRGLFPVIKLGATHEDDLVSAQSVQCAEEEDVFRVMGVRFKPPEERKTVLMKEDFLTPPKS